MKTHSKKEPWCQEFFLLAYLMEMAIVFIGYCQRSVKRDR